MKIDPQKSVKDVEGYDIGGCDEGCECKTCYDDCYHKDTQTCTSKSSIFF